MLGYAVAAVIRWTVTATVLTVVALLAGMNVFGGPVDVFGMYMLAFLINITGLLWACGVAMRFRTMQAGPVMQMPVFLILFFAPVYVPLALLTGWIETVATLNPITYVLEAVRSMLAGDEVHVALAFGLVIVLVGGSGLGASVACVRRRLLARSGTVAQCPSPRHHRSVPFRSSPRRSRFALGLPWRAPWPCAWKTAITR